MKIGWIPLSGDTISESHKSELAFIPPERLEIQEQVHQCPAHTTFMSKFFIVRAPWDLDLTYKYDRATQTFDIRSPDLNQVQFDLKVQPRPESVCKDGSIWITTSVRYLMLADEDCIMETYPAFLHGTPFEIAMGAFNINKWQRPCDFTFKMAPNTEISIKRGDPLFYIALKPADNSSPVLEQMSITEEVITQVDRCTGLKEYQKNVSWKMINTTGNCMRPKNFLTKENKWTSLISKLKSLFK